MTLSSLIRNECANFKRGGCLYGSPCVVLQGSPCGIKGTNGRDYLASSVLPLAAILQGYENAPLEYALIKPSTDKIKILTCPCGAIRKPRARLCDDCRKKALKEAQRKKRLKKT